VRECGKRSRTAFAAPTGHFLRSRTALAPPSWLAVLSGCSVITALADARESVPQTLMAPNTAFHRLRTASQSSPHCSLEPCIFGFEPFTGFELLDRGRVVGHTWTPWNVASFELWSALAPR
jgi:hypothetical protein